ncbi:MAG: S1C family serine protease [Thermoleophilaceae bacterium]
MNRAFGPVAAALVAAAVAVALGACTAGGDDSSVGDSSPRDVRTTRVQVVEGLGSKGGLDAAALYDRLSPGVVTIISIFDSGTGSRSRDGGEGGQGSGFVLADDGTIATNAHVVTDGQPPDTKKADKVYVEFSDGNRVRARVVGYDLNSDVALLKVDPAGLSIAPLRLGHSDDLRVGAPVAAIGSPFGERQSLSVGVISALDRSIESLTQFQIGDAIQTDAAINPGNSGGPLLSAKGRVLGINSQIKSTSGGGEGVGFAIPVDTVRRSLRSLRADGSVDYGYLGVTSQPLYPQLARKLGLPVTVGALVVEVQDGSPAADGGLSSGSNTVDFQGQRDIPSDGDVIVGVDGHKLTRRDDLADVIGARDSGDTVKLDVVRGGKRRTVKAKLGDRPERPPKTK